MRSSSKFPKTSPGRQGTAGGRGHIARPRAPELSPLSHRACGGVAPATRPPPRPTRTTLPRVFNQPQCRRTLLHASNFSDSYLLKHEPKQGLTSSSADGILLEKGIEEENLPARNVIVSNFPRAVVKKKAINPTMNHKLLTREYTPSWFGPASKIPQGLKKTDEKKLPPVLGAAAKQSETHDAQKDSPSKRAPAGGRVTGGRARPSPAFSLNYQTFISSTLPPGSMNVVDQRGEIVVEAKAIQRRQPRREQSPETGEKQKGERSMLTEWQPVFNITRNETIILPVLAIEGEVDFDDEEMEDPEVKADYKRRLSQALVEGGFREQTGQGGEDSRQSFIEAIEREKVENELIASLNDLPDSFFTPLNSPSHSPVGSPEPGESGESGVDVGSAGNRSPASPSQSPPGSQWSLDAARGTPRRQGYQNQPSSSKIPTHVKRISIGDSVQVRVVTRREGERMQGSRNSISNWNKQKAENLRRRSLKTNQTLPNMPSTSKAATSSRHSMKRESRDSIFEGNLPKPDKAGKKTVQKGALMETYLSDQAERIDNPTTPVSARGKDGSRRSKRWSCDVNLDDAVERRRDSHSTASKTSDKTDRSSKKEEKRRHSNKLDDKDGGTTHEASGGAVEKKSDPKMLTPTCLSPAVAEMCVSNEYARPTPSPRDSPQARDGYGTCPPMRIDSTRTTPSPSIVAAPYNNKIGLVSCSHSQPCSRRASEYIHDMLSISEPCSRRPSEFSGGNLSVDPQRDSGFGNELNLYIDSKASTPALLLDPQDLDQSRPQSSTSSSSLAVEEDNIASLPNSPYPQHTGRGVLRRRSSSMDSAMSRPGSDLLEVPFYTTIAKDRVPSSTDSPENSPIASPCSLTSSDECYGDLQAQVVHRVGDSSQPPVPLVVPCPPAKEPRVVEPPPPPPVDNNPAVIAPQVSLTTDDGDDFAVWFGRRGSIFIEEKGVEQDAPQPHTTTNEQGQVSLAVPIYPN